MPTVTGLAPDPRRPGYRLVDVDRGRFASLPGEAPDVLALRVGQALAPELFARLQALADLEAAYRAAARALALRAHARFDLRRRLLHKAHPPAAVDGALARLDAQGLLDDGRYAAQYAAAKAARGRGPSRLVADLLAQGVDRTVAEDAVRRALDEEGIAPEDAARAVAARRAAQLGDLPAPVRKRRLLAFLERRGYRGAWVRKVVEEVAG